ncbi:MAG: hypothetical protein EX272_12895 [Chromatiales bacterium]|nr:MAG: hypothetical protein EX272_12895 [Chromatiales bacterium]
MTGRLSLILLVAANLLPLAGVFLWDWDVFFLLLLFWCENVIIGLFGIARLVVAADRDTVVTGLFHPLFFLVHYGGFMFGHFMVLFGMYSDHIEELGANASPADYYSLVVDNLNWVAIAALFISHGWSFVENFMGRQEYERLSPMQAMGLPYKRMVITHVALIFGGFFLIETGQPLVGLILLIFMKIALDVTFHRKEHRRLGEVSPQVE